MGPRAKACFGLTVFLACLCTNAITFAGELIRLESAPVHLGELQKRLARERGERPKAASETIEVTCRNLRAMAHLPPLYISTDAMNFRKTPESTTLGAMCPLCWIAFRPVASRTPAPKRRRACCLPAKVML